MEDSGNSSQQLVANPQRVTRRSIIRPESEVRYGRVLNDQLEQSIRAVTPEAERSEVLGGYLQEGIQLSPQQLANHRGQGSASGKDTSTPSTLADEDNSTELKRRPSQRRTKTKEDLLAESSPGSIINKTRKRFGSITNTKMDPGLGSIGYPSVGGAANNANQSDISSSKPPGTPRRTISSDAAVGPAAATVSAPQFLDTDASKVLQLMKTTCGRMHGILFFRTIGTSIWDSGYCAINVGPGSLVCQKQGEVSASKTLIPDLRGCTVRTQFDSDTQSTYISVLLPKSGFGVQLRPPVPETFDSWLAALLCWQPLRPKGLHSKMTKPQAVSITDRRPVSQKRLSDYNVSKSTAIVKVGRMVLLDGPLPAGSQRHLSKRNADIDLLHEQGPWRRVSCTLHENGTFKLLTEGDAKTICVVRLSQLTRCAVQRLDDSVLDAPFSLAIYPQYTIQNSISRRSQPLVLGLESKAAYEAWFVLLRALTVPELYGPEQRLPGVREGVRSDTTSENADMFRIERCLSMKITEAKLDSGRITEFTLGPQGMRSRNNHANAGEVDIYADVLFGRDLMARTTTKSSSTSAFWAQEFFLPDVPSMLSTISVIVKVGNPAEREWTMIAHHDYDLSSGDPNRLSGMNGLEIASHDPDFGKVEILVDDLDGEKAIEKWWPLLDKNGQQVGQVLMRVNLTENVVLLDAEYEPLKRLLHSFDNSLTTQIGHILSGDLKSLSDVLLDVFQASDSIHDWIGALIDEEIDGIYKDTPPVRMRFSGRIHSNDSYESAEQRELLVRDLSRSATMEANLLFRGNSLVTKALDAHMRRLGKAYLEEVLGEKLQQIASRDLDTEVDPNKLQSRDLSQRNWSTLIQLTKNIWQSIATSASRCPTGLRLIFKHIRSCAEDRYGSFIRTVKYTSVSGFLFLRFFCPAILNPKLFGLLDDMPSERARRTFTLIAKALNVLASMSKFGTKEPWMEPMNKFIISATPDFKMYIEEICSVSLTQPVDIEPQYLAPTQIRSRLPPLSREGLPTLPFLLDAPRSYAALVDLWVDSAPDSMSESGSEDAVHTFHKICVGLRRKCRDLMADAEPAEKPDSNLEPQWQRILSERQKPKRSESGNHIVDTFAGISLDQDITALPQRGDPRRVYSPPRNDLYDQNTGGDSTPSSSTSANDQRHIAYSLNPGINPVFSSSTNSSTLSLETADDSRSKALPLGREGVPKTRFLDVTSNQNTRKRTKGGVDFGRGHKDQGQERNEF